MQNYLPKVLSSGKILTYPRNTKGKDKRKDVDKGKGIKANDNEVCNKNKFDVLNQCIEEEKGEGVESNRNKKGSNANKDIVVEDNTTAKAIDVPINNATDVGVTNDVIIVEIEGRIDHNVEVNVVSNDHETNKVIIEYQLQESMGHSENKEEDNGVGTKQGEEAHITEDMEDHDKNQELCVSDEQPDGAVLVEDMYKTELHSIVVEPTELDMNNTNKVPQMEDMGKGDEHEELGECLLVQSLSELPSLASESEIQSHGPIMISVDDKGVGSFPPSKEEFIQIAEVSRYDVEEVLDKAIK
ncbi:hypothetical protein K7X08_015050 [Anisodus acutangulus]|uniref:Uncharacterized protein n=1 Tax=Anisodus acutangulus TaxID=402998 RepID=A0A9Q1L532_9SOLA|nr:hypothetical protein K7X08_015050 [Anisodus acutangulus]